MNVWIFVTEPKLLGGMLAAVRPLGGRVSAVVVGPRELSDASAAAGADEIRWLEAPPGIPAEAYAPALAEVVAQAAPRVIVSTAEPASRVLLGAAAARLGAAVVPGMLAVGAVGDDVRIERAAIGGEVVETLVASGPVAAIFAGEDAPASSGSGGSVEAIDVGAADVRFVATQQAVAATGLTDAQRVVGFGRGVREKDDVALIERLAVALDAEIGCTMPIADDARWLEKSRYIGRSGQHIAPQLYLAIGIGGAPQHMEGVRDAKIVAAVNDDPDARVFRAADYGIVGDLYEVVPALVEAIENTRGGGA